MVVVAAVAPLVATFSFAGQNLRVKVTAIFPSSYSSSSSFSSSSCFHPPPCPNGGGIGGGSSTIGGQIFN